MNNHILEAVAKAAYEAYNEAGVNKWKTFDGRDVPQWEALNDAVKEKWMAATKQVDRILNGST
jgi:hypothetical protein